MSGQSRDVYSLNDRPSQAFLAVINTETALYPLIEKACISEPKPRG